MSELLASKREEILRIAVRYEASNIPVFGSLAHGEAGPESDVEVNEKALHQCIKDRVLREATPL